MPGQRTATVGPLAGEDGLAQVVWKLVLNRVARRCSSMSWHSHGWPGLFAMLASVSPLVRQGALQTLRRGWKALTRASECQLPVSTSAKQSDRAPFQLP